MQMLKPLNQFWQENKHELRKAWFVQFKGQILILRLDNHFLKVATCTQPRYNPALNISTRIALEIYNNNLKLYLICLANIVHSCIYKWLAIGSLYNLCYICLVDILSVYNHSVWNIWIEKKEHYICVIYQSR